MISDYPTIFPFFHYQFLYPVETISLNMGSNILRTTFTRELSFQKSQQYVLLF